MSGAPLPVVFAIPGDIATATGGYAYDRRILALAPAHGLDMRHLALPAAFPYPSDVDLAVTARSLAAVRDGAVLLVDGLACGALPPELMARPGRSIVALVHHPLGLEPGLAAKTKARLLASERLALSVVRRVIATSPTTARTLVAEFGVSADRIGVAEPGTDPEPRASGSGGAGAVALAVGSILPRKAYDVLIAALAGLQDLPWRLVIVGNLDRRPATTLALQAQIRVTGLDARVCLTGELAGEAVAAAYQRADFFVSSSLYEGYGMALAQAMAAGLPIVTTTGGAATETIPDGAGLKIPAGDSAALRSALRKMIENKDLRAGLAEASWQAGQRLPKWRDTVVRVAGVLRAAAAS